MQSLPVPQSPEVGVAEADREVRGLAVVAPAQDLAMGIDPGQGLAVAQGHIEPHRARAIVEENRNLALRSLLAHPLVRTVERSQAVLKAVWPTGGV